MRPVGDMMSVFARNEEETGSYQAVGATITFDVVLVSHISALKESNKPVQVATSSSTHERTTAVEETRLLFVWELL